MKRAEIIIKGDVQRVGYRDAVKKIARKLNINGYVENLKQDDVKIVAEGEEENLKGFIEIVNIKKYPINVESVEVNYKEATGEFEYFEIKRGDWQEELGERLDVAGAFLYRSVELGEKSVALGEKSVALGEKSVALGEKLVALGEKSVALGEKSVALGEKSVALGEKSVALGEKSVALGEKLYAEMHEFRTETKESFNILNTKMNILNDIKQDTTSIPTLLEEIYDLKSKYKKMESEIDKIKSVLKVPS